MYTCKIIYENSQFNLILLCQLKKYIFIFSERCLLSLCDLHLSQLCLFFRHNGKIDWTNLNPRLLLDNMKKMTEPHNTDNHGLQIMQDIMDRVRYSIYYLNQVTPITLAYFTHKNLTGNFNITG